jgi:hypothetical protein
VQQPDRQFAAYVNNENTWYRKWAFLVIESQLAVYAAKLNNNAIFFNKLKEE